MKIYDISMEIREDMAVYKDREEKSPRITVTRELNQGANESRLEFESHTGTHADAYFHMLAQGKTIEKIPLNKFMGNCVVLDFSSIKDKITIKDFNKIISNKTKNKKIIIKKNDIVLLKTRNKPLTKFDFKFTYLDKSGARFLAGKKIKCVGIDDLGIERNQSGHETHKILFKKDIVVVEGLELSKINAGRYFFIGLPLKIKRGDGSPIRAVLVKF
jgi:arylformamidase|tara:strand:+ start:2164 stop:2811 length:648 start_codon:yes stop_codon:yes gene_type:complete